MKSLIQYFEESVEKFSNNVYLWEKLQDKYEGTTYGEAKKQVYEFAAGLMQLGIKKGDRLCLISEGRNISILPAGFWRTISPDAGCFLFARENKGQLGKIP